MADPRNELADIVVPVAPDMMVSAGGLPWWLWTAGLLGVAGVMLMVWQWRRRRFARSLRAIAAAVARQQGTPVEIARLLDTWARGRFNLSRLDAAHCPQGLDPNHWSDWVNALTRLRFAPPPPGGTKELAGLCATAQAWKPDA
ncbi:MAG: DUF4381 family protein [Thiobacillus sp.]|nr:DUF4381 family protein [Thiobacillus sp.]